MQRPHRRLRGGGRLQGSSREPTPHLGLDAFGGYNNVRTLTPSAESQTEHHGAIHTEVQSFGRYHERSM